ncbi:hypothetical protein [Rhodoglobus vestalii]|uniref:hypothetical protein n=1 Tax=Rhodoglobus vestalii TaxID=193384 RepID=UPI001C033A2E|nr:hypothetical protein [Rhodoglobus vestalii]
MGAGHALNDYDRTPWLEIIAERIGAEIAAGNPTIVACSARKHSYRQLLTEKYPV